MVSAFDFLQQAILLGLFLSISVGPMFFKLIDFSIKRGVRPAIFFSMGVMSSDFIYSVATYASTSLFNHLTSNTWFNIIAGIVFAIYGIFTIRKKHVETNSTDPIQAKDFLVYYIKGFLLNTFNPLVIIFWVGASLVVSNHFNHALNFHQALIFYSCVIGVVFSVDLTKILGARKLKQIITTKILFRINIVAGALFVGFGVYFIANALHLFN